MKDWLGELVKINEDLYNIKAGAVGHVTADLPDDDVFAVHFEEYGWHTLSYKDDRPKFEVVDTCFGDDHIWTTEKPMKTEELPKGLKCDCGKMIWKG